MTWQAAPPPWSQQWGCFAEQSLDPFLLHPTSKLHSSSTLGNRKKPSCLKSCSFSYTNGSFEIFILLWILFLAINPCSPAFLSGVNGGDGLFSLQPVFCFYSCVLHIVSFSVFWFHIPHSLPHFYSPRKTSTPCCPWHLSFPGQPGIFPFVIFFFFFCSFLQNCTISFTII